MTPYSVYTIGHSTHTLETFLGLLATHAITCVIDVRSQPFSGRQPQFNQPALAAALKEKGILYAHFKEEFGARHTDLALLDAQGRVDFDKVRAAPAFRQGVERLRKAIELGYRPTLLCSEANPLDCHRFSMVSYQLVKENFTVQHILNDGSLLNNYDLESQLLQKYARKLPQSTLFETVTPEQQLEFAYRLRGQAVAYSVVTETEDDAID